MLDSEGRLLLQLLDNSGMDDFQLPIKWVPRVLGGRPSCLLLQSRAGWVLPRMPAVGCRSHGTSWLCCMLVTLAVPFPFPPVLQD